MKDGLAPGNICRNFDMLLLPEIRHTEATGAKSWINSIAKHLKIQEHTILTRVILHVAFWISMFCLLFMHSKLPLQGSWSDFSFYMFNGALLCIVAINHYVIAYGITRLVQKRRWGIVAACFVGLYMFSAYASILCLGLLAQLFPDNKVFQILLASYNLKGVHDIFTLNTFTWTMSFVLLYCMLTLSVKFYKQSQESAKKNLYLQKTNSELELNFLRSQINPHFFFNTLNSLYALVEDKDQTAASVIYSLSNIMRFALYDANTAEVEVEKELETIHSFLDIQAVRHSRRLTVNWEISPQLGHQHIPPLLLLTFVENAIKHGVDKYISQSCINIKAYRDAVNAFCFEVTNSLPPQKATAATEGIGISNTRRRLDLLYPGRHTLAIRQSETEYHIWLKIW